MQTVAIDDPDVCQSVMQLRCAKTAERIEILFGLKTPEGPRNNVSYGYLDRPTAMVAGFDAAFAKFDVERSCGKIYQ